MGGTFHCCSIEHSIAMSRDSGVLWLETHPAEKMQRRGRRANWRDSTFNTGILKVLGKVHPLLKISPKAMAVMDSRYAGSISLQRKHVKLPFLPYAVPDIRVSLLGTGRKRAQQFRIFRQAGKNIPLHITIQVLKLASNSLLVWSVL